MSSATGGQAEPKLKCAAPGFRAVCSGPILRPSRRMASPWGGLPRKARNTMWHWLRSNRSFLLLLIGFGLFRTAVAGWNPIPSGSMRPSLLEGDVVLAHLGEPRRGDVVTFSSPQDGTRLIKRLVALPGDVVEMRDEVLFINGEQARYEQAEALSEPVQPGVQRPATRLTESIQGHQRRVQWLQGVSARSSFGPVTVPEGQYLMLGDN